LAQFRINVKGTNTNSNFIVNNNIFVARSYSQSVGQMSSSFDNIQLLGTFDNNYYCRPIDDNLVFNISQPGTSSSFQKTFAEWQTFSSQDANSHKSPQAITSANDLQFEYNETKVAKVVTLNQPMIDVKGTKYVGSVTLQSFTSVVLIKDYNPVTGIPIIVSDSQTIVYPNPSKGSFTVRFSELPAAGSRIEVLDLSGRKIISRLITSSIEEFDLSGQATGIYLVKSILGSEEKIQKLVIQN